MARTLQEVSFRLISIPIPDGKDSPRGFIQTNLHPDGKDSPRDQALYTIVQYELHLKEWGSLVVTGGISF